MVADETPAFWASSESVMGLPCNSRRRPLRAQPQDCHGRHATLMFFFDAIKEGELTNSSNRPRVLVKLQVNQITTDNGQHPRKWNVTFGEYKGTVDLDDPGSLYTFFKNAAEEIALSAPVIVY